jgi:hypothetical protein
VRALKPCQIGLCQLIILVYCERLLKGGSCEFKVTLTFVYNTKVVVGIRPSWIECNGSLKGTKGSRDIPSFLVCKT